MYKDKAKQREADRERQKRRRDKVKAKGVTFEGVTQGVTSPAGVFVDAIGQVHPIDFEDRRKDYDLLESWADGKGSEQQRRYGQLARHYRMMHSRRGCYAASLREN